MDSRGRQQLRPCAAIYCRGPREDKRQKTKQNYKHLEFLKSTIIYIKNNSTSCQWEKEKATPEV